MKRSLLMVLGLALLAAGAYGLLATLEPLDPETVGRWRLTYGASALIGLVLLLLSVGRGER